MKKPYMHPGHAGTPAAHFPMGAFPFQWTCHGEPTQEPDGRLMLKVTEELYRQTAPQIDFYAEAKGWPVVVVRAKGGEDNAGEGRQEEGQEVLSE